MMLVVMDPHRLLVDVRLQGVIGIRKGWDFVGHALLLRRQPSALSCQLSAVFFRLKAEATV
jgi:hypothetical protein